MEDDIARAETVGSLLRPDYVREMRQGIRNGTVNEEQRRAVEDRAVLEAIELQERIGLDVITDGELRRTSWITTVAADHGRDPQAPVRRLQGRRGLAARAGSASGTTTPATPS